MTKDEALKLALEALELHLTHHEHGCVYLDPAVTAIKEALAQPEQEPVATAIVSKRKTDEHHITDIDLTLTEAGKRLDSGKHCLYTAPPAQTEQEPEHYCIDAVAWETFIHDYDRYVSGNPNYSWQNIREGLAAVIESATPPQPDPVIDKSAAVRIATALGWEPKRKQLTDEDVEKIIKSNMSLQMNLAGIRADFEAAHGIKENT